MAARGKARVLVDQELRRAIAVAKDSRQGQRDVALLQVSHRLGLRAKELAALRVHHVLAESGQLHEQIVMTGNMTKGGKARTIYLTNQIVRAALTEYLRERMRVEGICFNRSSALFKSQKGGPFSPNTMQQLFKRLYRKAGLEGARSHSGRRWFATELISKGVDLKAVSVLMGHSSVAMTAQYAEDNPNVLRRIAAELV